MREKLYNIKYKNTTIFKNKKMTEIPYLIVEYDINNNSKNLPVEAVIERFSVVDSCLDGNQKFILEENYISDSDKGNGISPNNRKNNYYNNTRPLLKFNKYKLGIYTQWKNNNDQSNFQKFIKKIAELNYYIENSHNKLGEKSMSENKNKELIDKLIEIVISEQKISKEDLGMIEESWYDMALIKDLPESCVGSKNEMNSHQSSIIIGTKNFGMFPVIKRSEFSEKVIGRHITVKLPIRLMSNNIKYLNEEKIEELNHIIHSFITTNEASANRLEFGTKKIDGKDYVDFYNSLYSNCKIVIIKLKSKCEYIVLGIREEDTEKYFGNINFEELNEINYFDFKNRINKPEQVTYLNVSELISNYDIDNDNNVIKRKTGATNIILYGVPGSGKSYIIKRDYCSEEKYMERVVFHPDYTYSDFVGQILPKLEEEKLKYEFTPGPFTKILKKAYDHPENEYYLIIEEINRGNAPAIFGEIFQLLDRIDETDEDHDASLIGESQYGITNYDIAKTVYGNEEDLVKIPSNLYILATMNTADQNVFTLDTAFQRRWDMKMIKNDIPKDQAANVIEGTEITWGAFVNEINSIIINNSSEIVSSEDKRLGAYFVKKNQMTIKRFPEKVLKYLWDDAFKIDRTPIFKDIYKSLEDIVKVYRDTNDTDRLEAVLNKDLYDKMLMNSKRQNNNFKENESDMIIKDAETEAKMNA